MPLHVSVIIPARNAADTLPDCLAALAQQSAAESLLEVIVVDDGSTDETAKIARVAGARVLAGGGRGAAAARNLGARQAAGEVLLFTDADCEPASDWIAAMLAPFADAQVVGAKGTYRTRQRELTARFVQCEYEDKYLRMARLPAIDFIDTYSAGYRREIFLAHGGFDESFPGANVEDQEFSFRLAAAGLRMVFQPAAVVGHRHAATWQSYLRKKFWIGYWKVKVHMRHPGRAVRDSHTPAVQKAQLGLLGLAVLGGLLSPLGRGPRWLAGLSLAGVLGSMLPFAAWAWKRDREVGLAAPAYLLGRAAALGAGLTAGLWALCRGRLGRSRP